jgi:hypothetical protein
VTYTVRYTRAVDPGTNQWADDFPAVVTDVNYLQCNITGYTGNRVQMSEIEVPWIRIRSRCRINNTAGTSFTEKYARSCVLTSTPGPGATIFRVMPSALANTNITSIWDQISSGVYSNAALF